MEKIKQLENVEILCPWEVKKIEGTEKVEGLLLQQVESSAGRSLQVDGLFVAVGSRPNSDLLQGLAEMDEKGYILAGEDCRTACPGVYVAGDVRSKPLRQVVTAVCDGANAATSVVKYNKKE